MRQTVELMSDKLDLITATFATISILYSLVLLIMTSIHQYYKKENDDLTMTMCFIFSTPLILTLLYLWVKNTTGGVPEYLSTIMLITVVALTVLIITRISLVIINLCKNNGNKNN